MTSTSGMEAQANCRLLIKFTVEGDLRFISHRDTMRLLARAVVRAGLPVAYTQGFNPHIRLSILMPRPVGMSTSGDLAVLRFSTAVDPEDVRRRLDAQMPAGAAVVSASRLPGNARPQPLAASYTMELPPPSRDLDLPRRLAALLEADSVMVSSRSGTTVDIRPYLRDMTLTESTLCWTAGFVDGRSLTPRDLCTALGLSWERLRHKIKRTNIEHH